MRIAIPKKIVNDGSIPADQQQLVENLGVILNQPLNDICTIINGGIGFDNLEQKIAKFSVKTDTNGALLAKVDITTGLNRLPYGSCCIDVRNSDNIGAVPELNGTPFIIYTPNNQTTVKIQSILNLKPNSKYTITAIFF